MRFLIKISYDGKNYSGFQIQPNKTTIQEVLEKKLSEVLKDNVKITASGRTDAGVSALGQICHFDYPYDIDIARVRSYINHLLPDDIRVLEMDKVGDDFNARYSANSKQYDYWFYIGEKVPVYEKIAVNIGYKLDIDSMNKACEYLIGEHDFTSFCASNTEVKDKIRHILRAEIVKLDDNLFKFSIVGNGFLYNMVRIMVGTLLDYCSGKITADTIYDAFISGKRELLGATAPPQGLFLEKVHYNEDFK